MCAQLDASDRDESRTLAKEARHMRLLRRGAQIESRLAEAWRTNGNYNNARALLAAAVVEDQFARKHHFVPQFWVRRFGCCGSDQSPSTLAAKAASSKVRSISPIRQVPRQRYEVYDAP